MKTFKQTIEKPRLVITHDDNADSPRGDQTVGYFFSTEGRYSSPDGTSHPLYKIMIETSEEAKSTDEHIALMREAANIAFKESEPKDGNGHDEDLHVIEIHPVYRYEHSNIIYKRGKGNGFDYSNCGFYFVTAQRQSGHTWCEGDLEKVIDAELAAYTQYANGEVYCFTLYDENGEIEDSCGGFYSVDEIKEALPEEWRDENLQEYLK